MPAPDETEIAAAGEIGRTASAALLAKIRPVFEEVWPEVAKTLTFTDRMIRHVAEWAGRMPDFRHIDAWRGSITRARASPFLRGETVERFKGMSFDWFLRPDTQANIANGLYDPKKPAKAEGKKDYGTSGPL